MKLNFLVDNKTENSECNAEWGLSILIESGGHKILFDTGASDMFEYNAKAMGIDLKEADALVISHGHYDHTQGVPAFSGLNDTAKIYIHKDAFSKFYGEDEPGKIDDYNCGIPWAEDEAFLESLKNRLVKTEGIIKLTDNITIVGNIPKYPGFEPSEHFYKEVLKSKTDGTWERSLEEDTMSHEQVLVVEEEKGLFIISGCSHNGIMSIIKYVKQLFPEKHIAGIIAGMHLYALRGKKLDAIVNEIDALGLEVLIPLHCTGMNALLAFKNAMGDRCVLATSGDIYEC